MILFDFDYLQIPSHHCCHINPYRNRNNYLVNIISCNAISIVSDISRAMFLFLFKYSAAFQRTVSVLHTVRRPFYNTFHFVRVKGVKRLCRKEAGAGGKSLTTILMTSQIQQSTFKSVSIISKPEKKKLPPCSFTFMPSPSQRGY